VGLGDNTEGNDSAYKLANTMNSIQQNIKDEEKQEVI